MDSLMCLYGSVTGKAESVAEQIVELGQSKGVEVGRDRCICRWRWAG